MAASHTWTNAIAPSLADFDALAASAWEKLPAEFREMAGDVIIRIEDFASDDVLDSLGIEDPFELTGLYQGVSLDNKSVADSAAEPDIVYLYRRPILDEWTDGEEALGHLVAHVLVHEIGHHFGLSDDDMQDAEQDARS